MPETDAGSEDIRQQRVHHFEGAIKLLLITGIGSKWHKAVEQLIRHGGPRTGCFLETISVPAEKNESF